MGPLRFLLCHHTLLQGIDHPGGEHLPLQLLFKNVRLDD